MWTWQAIAYLGLLAEYSTFEFQAPPQDPVIMNVVDTPLHVNDPQALVAVSP